MSDVPTLPQPQPRRYRGGARLATVAVSVQVATPILGGSSRAREIDAVEGIRAATVRGHLRFWWRALHGHEFARSEDIHAAEACLWGHAATDGKGRSQVEVRVDVDQWGLVDDRQVRLSGAGDLPETPGAYALWPARKPSAPRRRPGTRFTLTLVVPRDREAEVREVVRAWLLFGGYGSRTRRGLGSLTVTSQAGDWLPGRATREAFQDLFGRDVFAPASSGPVQTPWLAGAALRVGGAGRDGRDAMAAWTTALEWLREFRQGTRGGPGDRAREPGDGKPKPGRPSISNWPEADKIRHLAGKTAAHNPRYNATPAWPRAGFGLPIGGQFQREARDGARRLDEPGPFRLLWLSKSGPRDRLASPLIVKALPLADGRFSPCALWLTRAHPEGEVILEGLGESAAPFDRLVAAGDTARFADLVGRATLRDAFLGWLQAHQRTEVVAP